MMLDPHHTVQVTAFIFSVDVSESASYCVLCRLQLSFFPLTFPDPHHTVQVTAFIFSVDVSGSGRTSDSKSDLEKLYLFGGKLILATNLRKKKMLLATNLRKKKMLIIHLHLDLGFVSKTCFKTDPDGSDPDRNTRMN